MSEKNVYDNTVDTKKTRITFNKEIGLMNFDEYPTKTELSKLRILIIFIELSLKFIIPSMVIPSINTLFIEYVVSVEMKTEIITPNKKMKELKPIDKVKSNITF